MKQPSLRVLEIFDSLQGEGVWAGVPMTFVRLAGCNAPQRGLACVRWCDTPQSWDPAAGEKFLVSTLLERRTLPRVCLTGGEPLLQREALPVLIPAWQARGVGVHVESNGTLELPEGLKPDWLAVSPKPPDYTVSPELAGQVNELKVIVDAEFGPAASERIESLASQMPGAAICLQPEASGGEDLVARALDSIMEHPEWRLSLQLHKLLGIR